MLPVNKKFKTMSRSMTELVGLVGKSPWDEVNVFKTRPSSPKSPSFDKQPAAKKPKVTPSFPSSTATIQNILLQQIKQNPGKEESISAQYKKEKSPTMLVNKHYHRIGLRERLARKSLTFDEEWNRKEALRREEHIIKRAEGILETRNELTNTLCLEILDLSDETFHTLLISHPKMSIQSVTNLITTAWAKNAECELQTVKRRKFASLARLCILPKLMEQIELRSVLPSYQKLLAIDHDVVIENILVPLAQMHLPIPKPLLDGIHTQGLVRMIIDWLYSTEVRLSEALASNILILLNNEPEYFLEPTGSKFLNILREAMRSQPQDIHVASLFNYVVRKYIHNFKEQEIRFLEAVNDQNCTLLKVSIAKLLSSRLRRASLSEPMETDSF